MKQISQKHLDKQQGAASLVTAIILLISITLVVLLTAKTVSMSTKMSADNYRTTQAVAAANSGMDYAMDYLKAAGFDQDSSGVVDTLVFPDLVADATYGGKTTTAAITLYTDPDPLTAGGVAEADKAKSCIGDTAAQSMDAGLIEATGLSDDGLASRTITQCVGPLNLLRDDGPDQPLVSQGSVAATGNVTIINRFSNTTIWSGGIVDIGASVAMATYIKSTVTVPDPLTEPDKISTDMTVGANPTPVNSQLVSSKNLGLGLDIIDDDPSLDTLEGLEFFKNAFNADSREDIKQQAKDLGQYYLAADIGDADGKTGLIWIEGDATLNGGTYGVAPVAGVPGIPAIIVINGDLTTAGNPTIYGLLYITGEYTIGGTVTVIGSSLVEGSDMTTDPLVPLTTDAVIGNGTLDLVFWPAFNGSAGTLTPGKATAVNGSWKDWQ